MNHRFGWSLAWIVLTLLSAGCAPRSGSAADGPTGAGRSTTVVLVRHAEKATDDARDPTLSEAGQRRASALADALQHARVSAIYVTQYRRTRLTAAPTAERNGLIPIERPVDTTNLERFATDLAAEIRALHQGGTVLVVGHSNTTPDVVRALGGYAAPMPDDEYDRLTVLVVPTAAATSTITGRYGATR